jgi:hypothetical protein
MKKVFSGPLNMCSTGRVINCQNLIEF